MRSRSAARRYVEKKGEDAWNLTGGIMAWKRAGCRTLQRDFLPISIDRQVQIVAGALVLAGALLGRFVSPWFLALSGLVGAGLLFSGATGLCGMGIFLGKLPFNQPGRCAPGSTAPKD